MMLVVTDAFPMRLSCDWQYAPVLFLIVGVEFEKNDVSLEEGCG